MNAIDTIITAIAFALAALNTSDVVDQAVAAIALLPVRTVASNDFASIAEFLRTLGVEADTRVVGEAVDRLFPEGLPAGAEVELPDWACRPGVGMVWFGDLEISR